MLWIVLKKTAPINWKSDGVYYRYVLLFKMSTFSKQYVIRMLLTSRLYALYETTPAVCSSIVMFASIITILTLPHPYAPLPSYDAIQFSSCVIGPCTFVQLSILFSVYTLFFFMGNHMFCIQYLHIVIKPSMLDLILLN